MKAYKLEVLVIGHENISKEDVINEIEWCRHASPRVYSCKEAEIGEWHDDHPLNKIQGREEAMKNFNWE